MAIINDQTNTISDEASRHFQALWNAMMKIALTLFQLLQVPLYKAAFSFMVLILEIWNWEQNNEYKLNVEV